MNKLERLVYNIVRSNPILKNKIRNLYQNFFDSMPSPSSNSAYQIIERPGYFYGFHDHSPFSSDNSKLLANKAKFDLRMPEERDLLEVGYFDGKDHKNFNKLGETHAWSWHMGCKLQWVGKTNQVIFNDHIGGKNIARIIDIDTKHERQLQSAIGSVSPNGLWAVGYSFARIQKCMPGYGYIQNVDEPDIDELIPKTGIYKVNLETGLREDILSLRDLVNVQPEDSMKNMKHYVTHTVISPDSSRFIFLHRWIDPKGAVDKRISRLVVANFNGEIVEIFNTDGMVSHIGWQDSNHVVAYCRLPKFDDKFAIFEIGKPAQTSIIGMSTLSSDGHPSFDSSGRWMVADSYPDRRRRQNLIIFDTKNNARYDISKLYQPKEFQSPSHYQHWGCDLHPRWDRHSELVCFDSTFNGSRSLCTINFGKDILSERIKFLTRKQES